MMIMTILVIIHPTSTSYQHPDHDDQHDNDENHDYQHNNDDNHDDQHNNDDNHNDGIDDNAASNEIPICLFLDCLFYKNTKQNLYITFYQRDHSLCVRFIKTAFLCEDL